MFGVVDQILGLYLAHNIQFYRLSAIMCGIDSACYIMSWHTAAFTLTCAGVNGSQLFYNLSTTAPIFYILVNMILDPFALFSQYDT